MSSHIIETKSVRHVLEKILETKSPESTLILLDIDNTVFKPHDELHRSSHQWFDGYVNYLMKTEGYELEKARDVAREMSYEMHDKVTVIEIEPGNTIYFNELAQKYSVIGLTLRPYALLLETHRQLSSIAIDEQGLHRIPLNFKLHEFPDLDIEFGPEPENAATNNRYQKIIQELPQSTISNKSGLKSYARFHNGVMFTSHANSKGAALIALLKTINLGHFETIILVDDQIKYIESVGPEVAEYNAEHHTTIEFIGIHYTATSALFDNFNFDPNLHLKKFE